MYCTFVRLQLHASNQWIVSFKFFHVISLAGFVVLFSIPRLYEDHQVCIIQKNPFLKSGKIGSCILGSCWWFSRFLVSSWFLWRRYLVYQKKKIGFSMYVFSCNISLQSPSHTPWLSYSNLIVTHMFKKLPYLVSKIANFCQQVLKPLVSYTQVVNVVKISQPSRPTDVQLEWFLNFFHKSTWKKTFFVELTLLPYFTG